MDRGGSRRSWRKILLITAGAALALLLVPAIMLGLAGKYRLLMKMRHAGHYLKSPAVSKTQPADITTGKDTKQLSTSNRQEEHLEKILREYTVDFYFSRMKSSDGPDGDSEDSASSQNLKLPAVQVPFSVGRIAGLDNDKSYSSRMLDVSRLGRNLSEKEITALLYFLHKKSKDDVLPLLEFDAIKNDVATIIMDQERHCAEFAPHLIAMYYDKSLDDVWRDYCVQFLGQCYAKIDPPQERLIVRNLFNAALKDRAGIPGAALIAMGGLADNPEFSRNEIAGAAYALCIDEKTDDMIKTTALQICAKFKKREILPVAREIVRTSENVPLKMSAIAAIGAIGEKSDQDTLQSLVKSSDVRMRTASKAALKRMGVN